MRLWNVALILEDAEEHKIAQERFQEAIDYRRDSKGSGREYREWGRSNNTSP
jgi:hypothetical protein